MHKHHRKQSTMHRPKPDRVLPVLRLLSLLACVGAVLALATARQASAHADRALVDAGRAALRLADARYLGRTQTLRINGVALRLAVGVSALPPDELLARMRDRCQRLEGHSWTELAGNAAVAPPPPIPRAGSLRPTIAGAAGRAGYVACIELPRPWDLTALSAWARRASAEGGLRTPGPLRYVLAEPVNGETRFVAIWTDGPVPLADLIDAGSETAATHWPQPQRARLLWDAEVEQAGPRALLYEPQDAGDARESNAADGTDAPVTRYADRLRAAGYEVTPQSPTKVAPGAFSARRGDHRLLVSPGRGGGQGVLGVASWHAPGPGTQPAPTPTDSGGR